MGSTFTWIAVAAVAILAVGLLVVIPGGGDQSSPGAVENAAPANQIEPTLPADTTSDAAGG